MSNHKVVVSWSGGKDSAMAYHLAQKSEEFDIVGILTTVTDEYERISMHGIRRVLLEAQAAALGVPLYEVRIPVGCPHEEYEKNMQVQMDSLKAEGISGVIIGDIFLEDLKKYREEKLAQAGLKAFSPLWQRSTTLLAREFISAGFKAKLTCIDTEKLDGSFAGREYDAALLADLPADCDPCGENGEFHSFTWDGPVFSAPVAHTTGEAVLRDGRFMFCDMVPAVKD